MNARQKAKYYKRKYEMLLKQPVQFKVEQHQIDTLCVQRIYSDREIADDFIQATIKRDIGLEIANQIDKFIEYRIDHLPEIQKHRLRAFVRIVEVD